MSAAVTEAIVEGYLKRLKLPAVSREYVSLAREAEHNGAGYVEYLRALLEQEVRQRDEHQLQRRLRQASFPYDKRLEEFDFSALRSVQKARVMELSRGEFVRRRENLILLGSSGLGKTHLLIGLGRALCFEGHSVLFRTAASLANELELAQRELRIEKLQRQYRRYDLLLVDELGYLPVSHTAAQLLFGLLSDRYERASVGITTNLDFAHWTEVFGNERMTAALLDRLTHRSHIIVFKKVITLVHQGECGRSAS
ncbi:MAG: IS21-like element helper ATPase IstB [Chloroflexota bacterium]|nr:IS21-like element helper ATPase IstB [Chloroflexota bacterium]